MPLMTTIYPTTNLGAPVAADGFATFTVLVHSATNALYTMVKVTVPYVNAVPELDAVIYDVKHELSNHAVGGSPWLAIKVTNVAAQLKLTVDVENIAPYTTALAKVSAPVFTACV